MRFWKCRITAASVLGIDIAGAADREVNRGGRLEQDDRPLVSVKATTEPGTKAPASFGRCIPNRHESDQNFDCAIDTPGNFLQQKERARNHQARHNDFHTADVLNLKHVFMKAL